MSKGIGRQGLATTCYLPGTPFDYLSLQVASVLSVPVVIQRHSSTSAWLSTISIDGPRAIYSIPIGRGGDPEVGAVWPSEGLIRPLRDGLLGFNGDMSSLAESYDEQSVDLISRGPALKLSEVPRLAPILAPRRNGFCVKELQGICKGIPPERLRWVRVA